MITVLILLATFGILGWGLYRSRSYGRLGILSWLQSVVVMLPWLLFFGLSTVGIVLNLASILMLLVLSTGVYIWLGYRLRTVAKDVERNSVSSASLSRADASNSETVSKGASPVSATDDSTLENGTEGQVKSSIQIEDSAPEDLPHNPPSLDVNEPIGIPADDLLSIQSIFGIDTFFSTEHTSYYNGMIFKGNLRGEAKDVHRKLSQRLVSAVGSEYRLFLMEDPASKPIVVVFPRKNDPVPSSRLQWMTAGLLVVVTFLTCMMATAMLQGFDLLQDSSRWLETLPLTLGVVTILGGHEFGHWVAARRYDVRLSPPFFLPTWQLGTFGALTRIESILPHRTALFDIAFAGPAVGGGVSLVLFLLGLLLSHAGSLFQLSPSFFQSSILVGTLARVVLGSGLQQDIVDIHPLVIVGWLGLIITAINVMPIGQLDGGRVVQSIYGRKVVRRTSIVALIVLAIATLFNPLALYWLVVVLLLQRRLEQPQLNELTEPDDTRAALGLLALFLMAAILLPLSPELAGRLGIGG